MVNLSKRVDIMPTTDIELSKQILKEFGSDVKPYLSNSMHITFYLYKSESIKAPDKILDTFTNNKISACFSEVPYALKGKKDTYNRLLYIFGETHNYMECTAYDKRIIWINESIKNHTLPEYILESDIKNNKYVIQLDEDKLSPSLLYIYLTTLRVMDEDPGFVENMLVLINNYQISYYLAWILASKISHGNSNHNLIPISRNGGITETNVNKVSGLNIRYALSLKAYLSDPHGYDTRSVYSGDKGNIFRTLEDSLVRYKIKRPDGSYTDVCNVNAPYLLSNVIERLMKVDSSKEINSIISEIKHSKETK
jgi:hypothetical protein